MNSQSIKGRPKMTRVEKASRDCARSVLRFRDAENDFMREIGAAFRESSYEKSQLAANAEKRVKLWAAIDDVTGQVNDARRNGDLVREKALKGDRSSLYAALNDVPPLGYTRVEWQAEREEEGAKMGRPAIGVDAVFSRRTRELARAEDTLEQAVRETGEQPAPLSEVIYQVSRDGAGRPRNLPVDELSREIEVLDEAIRYIVSGEAAADREAKIAERMAREGVTHPDRLNGRRFKSLALMLNERMAKRAKLQADYLSAVARLTDDQRAKHQARVVSRTVKRVTRQAANDECPVGGWGVAEVRQAYEQALALKPYKPLPARKPRQPGSTLAVRTPVQRAELDEVGAAVQRMLDSVRKKG